MMLQIIGAYLATIALAVYLGVPKRFRLSVGLVGAIGWFVYLILGQGEEHLVLRTFASAMAISLVSHIFARVRKAPVTIFLISGILPLVPGTGMYRTVYQMIIGNRTLAGIYFSQTLQIAGVIALAIFIMDSVFRILQNEMDKKARV